MARFRGPAYQSHSVSTEQLIVREHCKECHIEKEVAKCYNGDPNNQSPRKISNIKRDDI